MTGRDGRCDPDVYVRPFQKSGKPTYTDLSEQERFDFVWSQVKKRLAESRPFSSGADVVPEKMAEPVQDAPARASSDAAIREMGVAERSQPSNQAITLCATTNKVKHKSKLWALHHRNQLAALPDELHPEQLNAYKCKWCGTWHVGHRS
jgi:hypothetical protein